MAHISPTVYLVWALLAVMVLVLCLVVPLTHISSSSGPFLYSISGALIDSSPYAGAFKRVMTYSYLLSIPFIIVFAAGFAIIKYNYGYTVIPEYGVQPTPYQEWSRSAQNAIFPCTSPSLSVGALKCEWSGVFLPSIKLTQVPPPRVTHLEGTRVDAPSLDELIDNEWIELCFWLFLVNSSSAQQDWFKSLYFKTWAVGSCIAVLVMPLITMFTRENVLKCEAYTFLTGGLASLSMTIWFIPVLWTFPSFIANLKGKDVETATLVRLTKYHELNCIRVVFRFLFTVPLVILGVDGIRPHQHINGKMLPTDLLGILAAIGCIVSSGITLVIFFPRSIEGEMTHKEQQRTHRRQRAEQSLARWNRTHTLTDAAQSYISITQQSKTELDLSLTGSCVLPAYEVVPPIKGMMLEDDIDIKAASISMGYMGGSFSLQPNRRTTAGEVALGAVLTNSEVEFAKARSKRDRTVSRLVHQWRSPIDIARPVVSRWQESV
ncbi:hypothetical protein JVT61DRAFT_788 [Boletus reticuloceps]|uniref:Uncharacterized protein n=1 Tax=Boletus reticuloceps TaxID=495285 RepID=A0A8I2YZA1_9AGAM|nr:hypothetical protein JVT61DRAFT_788 [Boletus reticuloceps]